MESRIVIDHPTLLDLVHDRWFDLETVAYDREQKELRVYFGEHRRGPYDEKLLRLTDVLEVVIDDSEQVQVYDISDIAFESSSVTITGNIPIRIKATVGPQCTLYVMDHSRSIPRK